MKTGRILKTMAIATLLGLSGCATRGPKALHMLADSGDRALARGDCAQAERDYAEYVQRDQSDGRARLQYGKALLCLGRVKEARENLEKAYTVMPNNDDAIFTLAEARAQDRDMEGAVRLVRAVAEDRKRPSDWILLGKFLERANAHDDAEQAYLSAARGDLGYSLAPQLALAEFYERVGQREQAIERYRMCLYVSPGNREMAKRLQAYGVPGTRASAVRPPEQLPPTTTQVPVSP